MTEDRAHALAEWLYGDKTGSVCGGLSPAQKAYGSIRQNTTEVKAMEASREPPTSS